MSASLASSGAFVEQSESLSVSPGDVFDVYEAGITSSSAFYVSAVFVPSVAGQFVIPSYRNGQVNNSETTYYTLTGRSPDSVQPTESLAQEIGGSLQIQGIFARTTVEPGSGAQWAYTLRDNGANTSLNTITSGTNLTSCTTSTAVAGCTTGSAVTVNNFDLLDTSAVPTGSPAISNNTYGVGISYLAYTPQLAFSIEPPATGTTGTALSPVVVELQDENGNPLSGSAAQVTISSSPAGVSGTLTVNAVNGEATYNNLAFNAMGTYTLSAVATGLTAVSSSSISISAGSAPVASLSSPVTFPNTLSGTTSSALAATLSNTGTATLNNIVPTITGTNPSDFALSTGANACGATLAAGSSCMIYVTFTPASASSFTATLSVADSASGSPQTSTLTGTGTAPVASLSSPVTFPSTLSGTTSSALAATLSNTGTATLNNIVPTITGANPSDFALSTGANACGSTLAAGSSCMIYVTFTPASASSFTATLSVADSASGSPQTATLTGTGTAPAASLSSSISFPSTTVGTTSSAMAATLSNTGTATLNNIVPTITGANPSDFALSTGANACGSTLAAGSSCMIYVTFTPASASSFTATLSVADSASGSPQTSTLTGTGTAGGPTTWPNGYTYQATFTVGAGKVPSAQTNFPALISGTYAAFATTANGGRISNTCNQTVGNNVTSVPCDLIFTSDAAGTQLLSWEFETYAAATGAVNIWVNVPSLASGTVIYAWYGQPSVTTLQTTPSATWPNYQAVYHMKENPAGTAPQLNDSTGNGNNATMEGPVTASQQQAGEIDGSINFEGNTYASLASSSTFSFERTDSFSVSGWLKIGANTTGALIGKYPDPAGAGWALAQLPGTSSPQFAIGLFGSGGSTSALAETPQVSMGVWHYMVATYSGTGNTAGMIIYVDGVNQTLTTKYNNLATSILNNDAPAINSRVVTAAQESDDVMDEVRVSAKGVVLTPAWVTASYNNQSSPGTFFTVATGLTNP